MIVCSCNFITERDIEQTIISLLDEEQWRLIVPAQVYHAMTKKGKCCGCFPNVSQMIVRVTEEYHLRKQTPDNVIYTLLEKLKDKHKISESKRSNLRSAEIRTNNVA